jgi:K+-transporting ATPase ATPase C chain
MKTKLWKELRAAVMATMTLALLLCGVYPLAVWTVAQIVFPWKANGSMICGPKGPIGSVLISQSFTEPGFFHPRPSAAGSGHDPLSSGGSNLGPLSKTQFERAKTRIENFRRENRLGREVPVPVDAVTASASGLDPHIRVENAELQSERVAKARGIPRERILKLIAKFTEKPQLGILGEKRINVLLLNLELEKSR